MEEQPRKRPGRPRKVLRLPEVAAQDQSAVGIDAGDGQVSGDGAGTQENHQGEVLGWLEFVQRVVKAHTFYKHRIRTVWHPEPLWEHIETNVGNILVKKGAVRVQLNTAQFVDL